MKNTQSLWAQAKNILCIRLDQLGDVLMTTPAIRALRESVKGRRITLLTSWAGAELSRFVPEIDTVIRYDAPWIKNNRMQSNFDNSAVDFSMLDLLQQRRFDAAIIFTVYSQNPLPAALFAFLANIPLRLAYCRENPYYLLTDWVPETEPNEKIRHEVQRQLDLVAAVNCHAQKQNLSFRIPVRDAAQVMGILEQLGIDAKERWLVIHPGASAPSRRYPASHFAQVADQLVRQLGYPIIFTGSPNEILLIEEIRQQMRERSYSLAGKLSLGELAALISFSSLLISNNTGPVHIAAAVKTPIVDIYAMTNPQHGPWQVPHRLLSHDVPCKYCYRSVCPQVHHDCLRLITPEQVVTAVQDLLNETHTKPAVPILLHRNKRITPINPIHIFTVSKKCIH